MSTQIIPESASPTNVSAGGMLQPGEEVEDYRIEKLLSASGGEAEVYLCDKGSEKFALKYYYTKKPNLEVIEKIKAFSCPNIIPILHYGEYKGRFFAIMEYAVGGTLDDKGNDGTYRYLPVSDDDALQIIRETVSALEACHKAGIIHRDIKPGNLFYKNVENLPDGRFKGSGVLVGDFGIASIFDVDSGMSKHMTEAGAKTEGYAAPEAYSGVIGPEMDYYSLGVTLWVLLTGMEPFVNEKGHVMYSGQITLDTIQGKTVENLLSRSPTMSASMQKLIRGLLTVRHEKRWKKDEVMRHLAGESVEVFNEVRVLPLVEIGGESCSSFQEIARAILKHPEEGKRFVFKGGLSKYLIKIDQKLAERLLDVADRYSTENREDDGAVFVAFSLCPNMSFPLEHGLSISDLQEMLTVLNTDPDAILPFLRDEKRGFYAYLEAAGLSEQGKKVKEIVNATAGDIRAVSRIIAAFQGNVIKPFQDGINNEHRLASLDDLFKLPDYLKTRAMFFIARNYGLLPAWIENLTGRDIDSWLQLLAEKEKLIARWGTWEYFTLFMQGLTMQEIQLLIDSGRMKGPLRSLDFYQSEIGYAYLASNSLQKALPYYGRALEKDPSGIDAGGHSYNLGYAHALYRMGTPENWNKALVYLDRALGITPKDPQPLVIKGSCLHNLGKHNEAIASLNMALELNGEKSTILPLRAKCYDALGMKEKADEDRAEAEGKPIELNMDDFILDDLPDNPPEGNPGTRAAQPTARNVQGSTIEYELKIPCIYDKARSFSEGLATIEQDGKWGCIDKTGKEVIPCIYNGDTTYGGVFFSEGLAAVMQYHKWRYKWEWGGYVDKTGKKIIRGTYDQGNSFSEGLAAVEQNGKWGFIDKAGKKVVPCIYDEASHFSEGLAAVKQDGKWGYVDKTGKKVIPCTYDKEKCFLEGLARVRRIVGGNYKEVFINKAGKEIIPCIYNGPSDYQYYDGKWDFSEGLAAVNFNYKVGFIDKTGKEIIPCTYGDVRSFSEGLAAVEQNGKWGFIDKAGKKVVPCIYGNARSFSEGLAAVKQNGKWGFIDKAGKEVIPCIYGDNFYKCDFSEGLAMVKREGKWGYIDKTGKEIIPCIYEDAKSFSEGLAAVKQNGKWGFIGKVD